MSTSHAAAAEVRAEPSLQRGRIAERPCPACSAGRCEVFYDLRGIPSHSCLLMETRAEAMGFPRGDLMLAFCGHCGFIFNAAWDESLRQYSQRYEETQGFSPTFNAFARGLAQRYVDRYRLAGKTTLEIGCGKGEFLTLLCELSGGRGIGLDPAYIPARNRSPAAARIEFIRDYYGPAYAHLQADFIVCRHTLEHIGNVGQFLHELRETIGTRRDIPVFFELPDVARVLSEGAFWDLYYEHCSYFTAGSLARLFRQCGFDVVNVGVEYQGQYIILDALPAEGPTRGRPGPEADLERVRGLVEEFSVACGAAIARWNQFLQRAHRDDQRTVLWGSGSKGVAFLTTLGIRWDSGIQYVVDINPHRHGRYMPGTGQQIVPPQFLVEYRPHHVVVMNPVYVPEITAELERLGLAATVTAV